jgi:hypothetical protein
MESKAALILFLGVFIFILVVQFCMHNPKNPTDTYLKSRLLKKKEINEEFDPENGICNTVPLHSVVNNHVLSHSQHKTKKKVLVTGTRSLYY